MNRFEIIRHGGPVIDEEGVPKGSSSEVFVHVVFSHFNHSSLDVDVEFGPVARSVCTIVVVKH